VRAALIAGSGDLPAALAGAMAERPLVAAMEGFAPAGLVPDLTFRLERLVPFFHALRAAGVEGVCMAGAVTRPRIDPSRLDPGTALLVPRLAAAMARGDDATLREVVAIFREQGFAVLGAAELAPGLLVGAGVHAGAPAGADRADARRAAAIAGALGRVDVGQGCVVQQGLCLAVETLAGTDAMLASVAALPPGLRPDPARGRGLLYKAPKPGQEWRIDLPALGPETVARVAAAGLGGIAWQAGGVLCLHFARMQGLAREHGLFLWAREPDGEEDGPPEGQPPGGGGG